MRHEEGGLRAAVRARRPPHAARARYRYRPTARWPTHAGAEFLAARPLHCPTGWIYSAPPMPKLKMKTKSGAKKRFKLTAKGRIKRKHAYLRHILTPKRTKNKRKLRRGGYIAKTQEHQIKAMIPYGL